MFDFMTYFQFSIIVISMIMTPFVIATSSKSHLMFGFLILELAISQMFLLVPGQDGSPHAFSIGAIQYVEVAGLTLSATCSIAIAWFVFCYLVISRKMSYYNIAMVLLASIPVIIGLINAFSITAIPEALKIVLPFFVYVYLNGNICIKNIDWLQKLITILNVIMIGQVFLCKLLFGSFSAHNYYFEIKEETFGYFDHPHSFNGLLAFFCLWNVYRVNKKKNVKLNLVLFAISLLLMWFSGVRTYIVALLAGLGCIGLYAIRKQNMKPIRKYVYLAILLFVLFGPYLFSLFGAAREVSDVSSGRLIRWKNDLQYIFDSHPFVVLFGGGIGTIEKISCHFIGYEINSLNLYVDYLADYGALGMISLIIAYFMIFKGALVKEEKSFQLGLLMIMFVTSIINQVTIYLVIMIVAIMILLEIKYEALLNGCIDSD